MPYSYISYNTLQEVVDKVRLEIDQSPYISEVLLTDEDVYSSGGSLLHSPSTKFSDEDLVGRINKYMKVLASRIKAQHMPKTIEYVDAPFSDLSGLERLLFSRVFVNDKRSIYRRMDVIRRLHRTRNVINEDYPVFTFEDGKLITYPEDFEAGAYIVTTPEDSVSLEDTILFDVRLTRAIVLFVVGSIAMTLELQDIGEYYFNTIEFEIQGMALTTMNTMINEKEVDSEKF